MREFDPVMSMTIFASSSIDSSVGFPILIGPVTASGVFMSATRPSIKSSMKQNERVCEPSPDTEIISPKQGLHNEVRHNPPIVRVHSWAIGVENTGDLYAQAVLAPIVEKQRLGASLSFIIARTWSDRVDMTPIVFRLRMNLRVTIDFRG
jgi:hypothetical protein